MPVPIMPIPDKRETATNTVSDYSFLLNIPSSVLPTKKTVQASNQDASILFNIWANGKRSDKDEIIKIEGLDVSSRDIMRLKTMGFIIGSLEAVRLTSRGKTVVSTMALGETNKFKDQREQKSYTEILASMNKRGKKGFRTPKFASNTFNNLNLRDI